MATQVRFSARPLRAALFVLVLLSFLPAFSQTQRSSNTRDILAQKLVEATHAQHPEVNELGIAMVTSQGCRSIASTDKSDVGEKCEPEDLQPMHTGKAVVGKENGGFDVSLPLQDSSGNLIGTLGIEFKSAPGQTKASAMQQAEKIAADIKAQIPSKASLLDSSK